MIKKLKEEIERLNEIEVQLLATPDKQISLTDPDARSMISIRAWKRFYFFVRRLAKL